VDIGRSVSRIGGAAQPEPVRLAARNLRILHSRFEELESLSRVGLELEEGVEQEIARGRLLRALLRQPRLSPRTILEQVLAVLAVSEGWLDGLTPAQAPGFVERLVARVRADEAELADAIEQGKLPEDDWRERLRVLAGGLRPADAGEGAPDAEAADAGEDAPDAEAADAGEDAPDAEERAADAGEGTPGDEERAADDEEATSSSPDPGPDDAEPRP
jgi:hypothetical protein